MNVTIDAGRGRQHQVVTGDGGIRFLVAAVREGCRDFAAGNCNSRNVLAGDIGGSLSDADRRGAGAPTAGVGVILRDGYLGAVGQRRAFRHLRTNQVVLVRRNGDGRQDRDDRDDDHQFDQGETFLQRFHGWIPLWLVELVYWLGSPKVQAPDANPLASGPVSQKLRWREAPFMPKPGAAPRRKI